ncbi:MAG: HAMP domain-containing protein [Spirochaetaceae bacterium]|nr:HAMP domain-containing protein [Spirochaetaceae bacterium]
MSVKVLLLVYILLCVLTVFFSRNLFYEILIGGWKNPRLLELAVYFTIPIVLFILLGIYSVNAVRDLLVKKPCSRFQLRLITNFIIIVVLTALPVVLITIQSFYEVVRYWPNIRVQEALADANEFAVDIYTLRTEKYEIFMNRVDFDAFPGLYRNDETKLLGVDKNDIAAIQDFAAGRNDNWRSVFFTGHRELTLDVPPATIHGFVAQRIIPRDTDVVRYVDTRRKNILRVVSFNLGEGFDAGNELIRSETLRFEGINQIFFQNRGSLVFFYYGIFFLPILLMVLIIAFGFTQIMTQPIADLGEATMQVAKGDFKIQILTHPKDELGLLINNFNVMVQNLEKTRNDLVRSEKQSMWQSMAQQLAHEIKNPLTPIKLTAERVLRRCRNNPEKTNEILENSMIAIIQEVESLATLLDEFKTLARPIEPSLSTTNIRDATEEIIMPYKTSWSKVHFDTGGMYSGVEVKMDRKRLSQIIGNLVINAIDAMDGEGKIEIRTDLVNKRNCRYCRLSIQDTGKGIDKEVASKVLTPYFTTKESGTGLGLPIVERIVNDHGGGIWFNSSPGTGTTFFIDIPVKD